MRFDETAAHAPGSPCAAGQTQGTTQCHIQALNSQDLLRGCKTVAIEHNGEVYRLQNTRAGKLILTK